MTRLALLFAASLACGGDPPAMVQPRPPVARATALPTTASSASSIAAPAPTTKPPPGPLPAWLDPAFDERNPPLRARQVFADLLFGDARGPALNTPAAREKVSTVFPVIDEPARDAERVRLLCSAYGHRVALFVRRSDLALVTRKGAVLAAKEKELEAALTTPSAFASFVFNGGVDVGASREATNDIVPVKYKAGAVSVSGVMFRSQLDEVYEASITSDFRRNGKITFGAVLYDGWRGAAFGRLDPLTEGGFHEVETQRDGQRGRVRVRVRVPDGIITAWVDEAKVTKTSAGTPPRVSMGHATTRSSHDAIDVPQGTLFMLGDEPIGVVKLDGRYRCVASCAERTPTVTVHACNGAVNLVARFPSVR